MSRVELGILRRPLQLQRRRSTHDRHHRCYVLPRSVQDCIQTTDYILESFTSKYVNVSPGDLLPECSDVADVQVVTQCVASITPLLVTNDLGILDVDCV